ncbi:FANCD2 opposite strand protein isoform X1 [Balaenoptera acutorostrata]|uniref:FANCD2 opposite strand protein isoform X1 n=2 Tax=Balaenoptera acutorostrata TaxID=9767 RepID=A0ABM3UAN5_BALAC|nr:FANCD2 opposite strand protein isoform X1 [Balaenoptera acutorostrata]
MRPGNSGRHSGACGPRSSAGLSMAGYQLWSPWTPLDESFQWLRHTTPTPSSKHPFRACPCFPHTPSDLEVQLCSQEVTLVLDSPFLEPGVSPKLPCHTSELRTMNNKKGLVRKPQPVCLNGVDSVFGRVITAQPPKWTGTFRVSDKSAFCKIISREHQWPTGLKEPQIQMTVTMCKQMLRSILLLYATYKKCTFALQHSK